MKDLTCIYGLRLLSVALSRIFLLFTLVCIVVMFSVLHGLKIQAKFFFWIRPRIGPDVAGPARPDRAGLGLEKKTRLINRAGSSFRVRPAGRVRVQRNPTRCHS